MIRIGHWRLYAGRLYRVMQCTQGTMTLLHVVLVNPLTRRSEAVQSAIADETGGWIFGTMKFPGVSTETMVDAWRAFRHFYTKDVHRWPLYAEMTPKLAEHYLATYEGLVRTSRSAAHGLVTLECLRDA